MVNMLQKFKEGEVKVDKFYTFKAACAPKEYFDIDHEALGIPALPVELDYKDLRLRLDHISMYYPLRSLDLGSKDPADILSEEDVWTDANFVNLEMSNTSEFTIKMNIQEFEKIVNG